MEYKVFLKIELTILDGSDVQKNKESETRHSQLINELIELQRKRLAGIESAKQKEKQIKK